MFEDSTFESYGRIHTRSRNWSLAAFALNTSVVAALVIIPLIYPEALPNLRTMMVLTTPRAPQPEVKPIPVEVKGSAFHGQPQYADLHLTAPRQIPSIITRLDHMERPADGEQLISMDGTGPGGVVPGGAPFGAGTHQPSVVMKPQGTAHISSGVAAGLLIHKTIPSYPAIAKATGTQGTVVLQAIIAKSGRVEQLRIISGPAMLQQAALDAVATWQYRPYLLNGEPVDVETTINVVFTINR